VTQKPTGVCRIQEFATLAGLTVRALQTMWADKANWPEGDAKRFQINPAIQEFIVKAMNVKGR
jgi:hypothetical protein